MQYLRVQMPNQNTLIFQKNMHLIAENIQSKPEDKMKIPDFYYGKCIPTLSKESSKSSQSLVENYIQISPSKDKSCILINKEKAKSITEDKKAKLVGTKYSF